MPNTNHLKYLSMYSGKSSTSTAKYSIKLFLKSIYGDGNLEDLIARYFSEERDTEEDLKNFFVGIKHRPPTSIRTILSAVKIFLLENDIELSQRFWKRLKRRIRGNGTRTQDRIPSTKELKQILLQMPINGKSLFLVLVSSGARIGEILQIQLTDINLETEPAQINLRAEYTKNGNPRIAFISQEAKLFLLEYYKTREQYIKSTAERCSQYDLDTNRKLVFPFSTVNANYIWVLALRKSQLDMKDASTGRYRIHPHCLRKFLFHEGDIMSREFKHFLYTFETNHHKPQCDGCRRDFGIGDLVHQKKGKRNPWYCDVCYERFFK